jgi:hypothetical protein
LRASHRTQFRAIQRLAFASNKRFNAHLVC